MGLEIEAKTTLSKVGGLYVSTLTHNSPTDTLRNDIIRELFTSTSANPIVVAPLTTAFVINTAGATVGTVQFTSKGNYWVSGQFTPSVLSTVATIAVIGSTQYVEGGTTYNVSGTYFIGAYAFTLTAGWVYALTVSLSGNASASGLSLSPLGVANLASTPIVNFILDKLVANVTTRHRIGTAIWISNTGSTLLATTLTLSTLSSVSGLMNHGESAFTASGTLATIAVNTHLNQTLFVVSVPTLSVGTSDRGLLTITLTIQ